MNNLNVVPTLPPKPTGDEARRPGSDFRSPEVNNYSPRPLASKDTIMKKSLHDRLGNIKHKINISPFKGFLSFAQLVGGSILLALFINHFIFQSYQVYGLSMTPTLQDGDRLIISKTEKSFNLITGDDWLPDRGNIIVFKNPRNPDSPQLIKRVIGLPGERIVVIDGNITIFNQENPNGFMPDKSLGLELGITAGNVDITVPEGHIFVSGDHRESGGSLDSRNELGTVPLNLIVGQLVLRILPVSDAEVF